MDTGRALTMFLMLGAAGTSWANATGISGFSGSDGLSCQDCHRGAAAAVARFKGRGSLRPGERCDYLLTVSAPGGWYAGIDVAAERPAMKLTAGEWTKLMGGEVVQSVARSMRGGPVSFAFAVTAPEEPGEYRVFGSALVADGNGQPTGDAVGTASMTVKVDPAAQDTTPCQLTDARHALSWPVDANPPDHAPVPMSMEMHRESRRGTLPSLLAVFLLTGAALVRIVKSG
jgi:hypothetical protein